MGSRSHWESAVYPEPPAHSRTATMGGLIRTGPAHMGLSTHGGRRTPLLQVPSVDNIVRLRVAWSPANTAEGSVTLYKHSETPNVADIRVNVTIEPGCEALSLGQFRTMFVEYPDGFASLAIFVDLPGAERATLTVEVA